MISFFPTNTIHTSNKTQEFDKDITFFDDTTIPKDEAPYVKNKNYSMEMFRGMKFCVTHFTLNEETFNELCKLYNDKNSDIVISKTKFNDQEIIVFLQNNNISFVEYSKSYQIKLENLINGFKNNKKLFYFSQSKKSEKFAFKIEGKSIPFFSLEMYRTIMDLCTPYKPYIEYFESAGFIKKVFINPALESCKDLFTEPIVNLFKHKLEFKYLMKWTIPYAVILMLFNMLHNKISYEYDSVNVGEFEEIGIIGMNRSQVNLYINKNTGHLYSGRDNNKKIPKISDFPSVLPVYLSSDNKKAYSPIAGRVDVEKALKLNELSATDKSIIVFGTFLGLAYIHRYGIIHNDIKPGNIFLDIDNTPRIGDFDISFRDGEEDANERSGFTVGYTEDTPASEISYEKDIFCIGETINALSRGKKDKKMNELAEKLKEDKSRRYPLFWAAYLMVKEDYLFQGTDTNRFFSYAKEISKYALDKEILNGEEKNKMIKEKNEMFYSFLGILGKEPKYLIPALYYNEPECYRGMCEFGSVLCDIDINDDDIAVDYRRGLREIAKACKKEDPYAMLLMAKILNPCDEDYLHISQFIKPDFKLSAEFYRKACDKYHSDSFYERAGRSFMFSLGPERNLEQGLEYIRKVKDIQYRLIFTEYALNCGKMDKEVINCYEKEIRRVAKSKECDQKKKMEFLLLSEFYSLKFIKFSNLSFSSANEEKEMYNRLCRKINDLYESSIANNDTQEIYQELGTRLYFTLLLGLKLKKIPDNGNITKFYVLYAKRNPTDFVLGRGLLALSLFFLDKDNDYLREILESDNNSYGSTLFERARELYEEKTVPSDYETAFFKYSVTNETVPKSDTDKLLCSYWFLFANKFNEAFNMLETMRENSEALNRCASMKLIGAGCERNIEEGAHLLYKSFVKGMHHSAIVLSEIVASDIALDIIPENYKKGEEEYVRRDSFVSYLFKQYDDIKLMNEIAETDTSIQNAQGGGETAEDPNISTFAKENMQKEIKLV